MNLKEFVEEKKTTHVTVQHGINARITHVKGFDKYKDYKLIEGHTLWYRKDNKLVKEIYKEKPNVVKNITKVLGKIKRK